MEHILALESVSFRYPMAEAPVLQSVDLAVEPGERLLVLGPSGSGKSTLLSLAAGFVPDLVPGSVTGRVRRGTESIAIVLQNPRAQMIAPTVREELAFGLENRGIPAGEINERVTAIAATFGIGKLLEHAPAKLSGGECQRVSLAAAMAMEPQLLLLDEPTAYLDPPATRRFFDDLSEVSSGTTVILVEHRVKLARRVTGRAVRLTDDGHLEEASEPEKLSRYWFPAARPEPRPAEAEHAPADPVLRVTNLRHEYVPNTPVLDGVTLQIPRGQVVGLIGPNGCGKSTLLDRIARLLPGAPGAVHVSGRDVLEQKDAELYAALMILPQNPEHFFIYETVEQELAPHAAGSMEELLSRFRVHVPLSRSPYQLSEGQKRRLTFVCAYQEARPLLLLDEPEYGLDSDALATLIEGIRLLRDRGVTIVLATHAPELVAAVTDRTIMLWNGRAIFDDTTEAFLTSQDPRVRDFAPALEARR